MTPNTVSAWELMSPTEHAIAYAIFAILGLIVLFCLYNIIFHPTEHDREEMQKCLRKKILKDAYKRRYYYWFNKSYDHIDGMFKYGERDAYARKHAQEDLDKYKYI